jgi:Secretion system C-terminal sorting domain
MKNFTLLVLFFLCLTGIYAQPVVSLVHNDVNTLNRVTPINLVANGSFETGGPSTGNQVSYFWTRPCNSANVPPSWTANGDPSSYGFWGYFQSTDANQYIGLLLDGSGCDNSLQTTFTDAMLASAGDANNLLYFGNYELTVNGPAPSFNSTTGEYIPRAQVAAAEAAIGWTNNGAGAITKPIIISQTVTGLTAGNYYELEFWVSGEDAFGGPGGIFQLEVGGKKFWLATPGPDDPRGYGREERYHLVFQAPAASTVLSFKNYGHFGLANNPAMAPWFTGSGGTFSSELALDDVIINEKTITVSGKIWLDNNNNQNDDGGTEANYTGANHYVHLIGPDGKILYSALVDATGNYSFPAPMNTAGMSIQISTSTAALEGNPNTAAAPSGYTNTTPVTIALTTVTSNITNQNFGIKNTLLPISFGEFSATNNNDNTVLSWVTYSEQDASHFEIEKSIDGFTAAKKMTGKVVAAGNSSSKKQYTFTEKINSSPVNYYRVKMVDKNGSFAYSNVVSVKGSKNIFVQMGQNPFTDHINLTVQATAKDNAIVSITDLSGRKVVTTSARLVQGLNKVSINDLNNLPKGIYVLEVSALTESFKFKLMKN